VPVIVVTTCFQDQDLYQPSRFLGRPASRAPSADPLRLRHHLLLVPEEEDQDGDWHLLKRKHDSAAHEISFIKIKMLP